MFGRCDIFFNQVFGDGYKIIIDTLAFCFKACRMPFRAIFPAAANIGKDINTTTLDP